MAKTVAPLLSFGGTGTVAKTMTYASWRGIPYVRRYTVPGNPRTVAQQRVRGIFRTLNSMWLLLPAAARAPWDAFTRGRPLVDRNAFVGNNSRLLNDPMDPATDFDLFQASPGARGGLPPTNLTLTPTVGAIGITMAIPEAPTGWVLTNAVAVAFINQAPDAPFNGPFHVEVETSTPDDFAIEGLTNDEEYVVAVFLTWEKANGDTAYSISLGDTATPTA